MWSQDEPCVTSGNWVKFSEGKLRKWARPNRTPTDHQIEPQAPTRWCWSPLQCTVGLWQPSTMCGKPLQRESLPFDLIYQSLVLSYLPSRVSNTSHHCGIGQPARVCFVNENLHNVKPFVFWEGNQQAHTCALDAVGMPLYLGFKHTTVVLLCHPEMLTFGNGHLRNLKPFVSSSKPLGGPVLWKKAEEMFSNKCQASTRWCWQFKLTSSH